MQQNKPKETTTEKQEINYSTNKKTERCFFRPISVSTKVLMAFLLLTGIFTITSGYSLMKHHAIASKLRLISRGYLKMAFAIVEMRTMQRLHIAELGNISENRFSDKKGRITSIRRIRPIVFEKLKKDAISLKNLTGEQEELLFLNEFINYIETISYLYKEAEKYYEKLSNMPEGKTDAEAEKAIKHLEDEIGSNLRHLQNISVQRIHKAAARSEQIETRTLWLLSALILMTLSIGILATYLIHKLLIPLAEIRRGVEIIGSGNLDYRLKVRRYDEIGSFAHQLNTMAAQLQERDRRLILSERLAAIGKMASHIAHEVKNPLSSIGLNTELAMEEAINVSPDEKKKELLSLLQSIGKEVERLTNLINHYLQIGSQPKPTKSQVDIGELLDEVKDFFSLEFQESNVEVNLHIPEESVKALLDRDQIKQVVINLLKNSTEAMDKPLKKIDIFLSKVDENARIVISDTGCGMDQKEKEKIFEPFYSGKKGGSGLGLAITRQIILDHGGTIECSSTKGVGTTFEITLPLGIKE